jgi:hypothetical protein
MKLKKLLLLFVLLVTSCLLSFSIFGQAPAAGLVAYFPLNGNTTNSGSATITAVTTGTSYTTNKFGQANAAMQFAGSTSSYLAFIDNGNLDFTGNFTVSFLFYFTGTANAGMIDNCLNYNGWGVWCWNVNGPWNIQFNFRNGSVGSTLTQFTANTWHHVTAVRNNGTLSIYLNGALKQSATEGTQTPSYPIAPIAGAMGYTPNYNPYAGRMDEIRIYNRALTVSEIMQLASFTLPVKMGEFTASKQGTGTKLNWETITETNTSHFEIEKSTDGTNFSKIGNVTAKGNSTDKTNYSYLDMSASSAVVYYRLKMVDLDGTATYSRVIILKNDVSLVSLSLFPNPAQDVLQVQLPSGKKQITQIAITDAAGKTVYAKAIHLSQGQNAISIPIQHLAPGTYHLISTTGEERQAKTFIKQ